MVSNFALPASRRSPAAASVARAGLWGACPALWTAVRPVWDTHDEHLFDRLRAAGQVGFSVYLGETMPYSEYGAVGAAVASGLAR